MEEEDLVVCSAVVEEEHQLCMLSLWSEVQRWELPAVWFQNEKS